jgi:hypothetical protein
LPVNDMDCIALLQWALPQLDLQWSGFRKVRRQVCKRLERRITELQLDNFAAYRARLAVNPAEWIIFDQCCHITFSRLRVRSIAIEEQRESWKVRALMAEAELLEATAKTSNDAGCQNVSDLRYASLKRYLAKRFHPDYAPGQGIEKIVRNEIFKEIWNEVERLDQGVSATRFATAQSSTAA